MFDHTLCEELLRQVSDYLDDSIESGICKELEKHLAECGNCRILVDTLNKTIYLCQQFDADIELPSDARERLYKKLEIEDLIR